MKINTIHQRRLAQIWRAGGMIWLSAITLFFAGLDLYFAKLPKPQTIFIGIAILAITLFLFIWSIKLLHLAKKQLPDEKPDSKDGIQKGPNIRKWFLIILIIEIVGLNIATVSLLILHSFQYIVPVDILIVGLHFLPLGRIFSMPVYYFLGIFVSLITILTMIFIPVSSQIGNLLSIIAIPSLGFIFLNWIVIAYSLREGINYLRKL